MNRTAVGQLRARLALRTRWRGATAVKDDAQLRWWLQEWEPTLQGGGFHPADAGELLGEAPAATYLARRWQQARAEVIRVSQEAGGDADLFADRVVVDIGPGPLGFPDACPARVSIGVDPLAARFSEHGLLLPDSPAVYLATGAERMPLLTESADVVLARNSLDYVDDPERVLGEVRRILRPGGLAILLFDVGSAVTASEPHTLTPERIRAGLGNVTVVRERRWERPFATDGHRMMLVARH